MPTELPIACSLDASDLSGRLAEMADVGRAALVGAERAGTRATLRFRDRDDIRQRLAAIVAAEARCCAFLDMTLQTGADGLVLAISGPSDAAPILDELVGAFGAGAS